MAHSAASWERLDAQNPMATARRHLDYASLLILVLVASWQGLALGSRDFVPFATRGILLVAAWWFSVLWHELGHVAFARAAGLDPYAVLLGSGRSTLRLSCRGITLDCGWFPGPGLTMFGPERGDGLRWRTVAALLGGPIATVLLLVSAAVVLGQACRIDVATLPDPFRMVFTGACHDTPVHLASIGSALVVSNVLVLLTTVSPRIGQAGPLSLPSDLSTLADLLLHRTAPPIAVEEWPKQREFARCLALRQYEEAEHLARALLGAEPHRSTLRVELAKMLFLAGRYADAEDQFRTLLDVCTGNPGQPQDPNERAAELAAWILERSRWIDGDPRRQAEHIALQGLVAAWHDSVYSP